MTSKLRGGGGGSWARPTPTVRLPPWSPLFSFTFDAAGTNLTLPLPSSEPAMAPQCPKDRAQLPIMAEEVRKGLACNPPGSHSSLECLDSVSQVPSSGLSLMSLPLNCEPQEGGLWALMSLQHHPACKRRWRKFAE